MVDSYFIMCIIYVYIGYNPTIYIIIYIYIFRNGIQWGI